MNFLNDKFSEIAGDNTYADAVTRWAGQTHCLKAHGSELQFFSYFPAARADGKDAFFALLPEYEDAFEEGRMLPNCGIHLDVPGELKQQMKDTNRLLLIVDSAMFLVSDLAISMLCRWAGVTGDMSVNPGKHILSRNLRMATAIQERNMRLKLIYRSEGSVNKVFAVMSGAYTFKPQTCVLDVFHIIEGGHTLTVEGAEMSHPETVLWAELPDAEEEYRALFAASGTKLGDGHFRPLLEVRTSDIGRSALTVSSILEYADGSGMKYRVLMDEVPVIHTGAMEFEEKVDNTIFANIRKLPETMIQLMGMPIMDYTDVDLSTSAGQEKNVRAIEKAIRKGMKSCKDAFEGCTKKKRDLIRALVEEKNPMAQYTMFDIAMTFMALPNRTSGLSSSTVTALRRDCGKVPYTLASADSVPDKDDDVVLMPEE